MQKCKTIAIANQKGGVGKTTVSHNLGVGLANMGYKVALCDFDPQGNLTTCLGYQKPDELKNTISDAMLKSINDEPLDVREYLMQSQGVDFIPSNIQLSGIEPALVNVLSRESVLKDILSEIQEDYDYILIDSMPSLGFLTVNSLVAADSVIIPVQAEYLSQKGLEMLTKSINRVKKNINPNLKIDGIVVNMADTRTRLARKMIENLRVSCGGYFKIYKTMIPFSVKAKEAVVAGKSIYEYDPNGKLTEAFRDFTKEAVDCGKKTRDQTR